MTDVNHYNVYVDVSLIGVCSILFEIVFITQHK